MSKKSIIPNTSPMIRIKHTFVSLCLLPLAIASQAQVVLRTIKVEGSIINKSSNTQLTTGSSFQSTDMLEFKTPQSRAAVISPDRGRLIITPGNFTILQKSNFVPPIEEIPSGGKSSGEPDPFESISGLQVILLGRHIFIDPAKIPLDTNNSLS